MKLHNLAAIFAFIFCLNLFAGLEESFVKLEKADGYIAEELDVSIGKEIMKSPANFLRVLKNHRTKVARLDGLVGNFGPELVDDFKRQAIELKKRISALETVQDKGLETVKQECLKELRIQLKIREKP